MRFPARGSLSPQSTCTVIDSTAKLLQVRHRASFLILGSRTALGITSRPAHGASTRRPRPAPSSISAGYQSTRSSGLQSSRKKVS